MITLEPLTQPDQIKISDLLLLSDGKALFYGTAKHIRSGRHGTEVQFNLRKNRWFNIDMYLSGTSWAKQISIVRHGL